MIVFAFLLITLAYSEDIYLFEKKTGDSTEPSIKFSVAFKIDSNYFGNDQHESDCFYYDNDQFVKFKNENNDYDMKLYTSNECTQLVSEPNSFSLMKGDTEPPMLFSIEYSNGQTDTNKKTFKKIYVEDECEDQCKYEMTNLGAFQIKYENTNCTGNKTNVKSYHLGIGSDNIKYEMNKKQITVDFVQEDPSKVTEGEAAPKTFGGDSLENIEYPLMFSDEEAYTISSDGSIDEKNKLYPVRATDENVLATVKTENDTVYLFDTLDTQNKKQHIIFGKYCIRMKYKEDSEEEATIEECYKQGANVIDGNNSIVTFTPVSSQKTYYETDGSSGYSQYKTGFCEIEGNKFFMFDSINSVLADVPIARVDGMEQNCNPVKGNTITLLKVTQTKPSIAKTIREIDTDSQCTVNKTEDTAAHVQFMAIDTCVVARSNEVKKITVENNKVITYNYTSESDCKQNKNAIKSEYGTCNKCNKGTIIICDPSSDPKNDDSSSQPKINDVSSSSEKKPTPTPPPSSGASPSSMFITMLLMIFIFLF